MIERHHNKTIGHVLAENMTVCIITLLSMGLFMVLNATTHKGQFGQTISLLTIKQFTWDFLGLACFITIVFFIKPAQVKAAAPWLGLLSLILLIGVLVFGYKVNNATRWFRFGFIKFQPSEFSKVAAIIFFAWYFERYKHNIDRFSGMLKALVCIVVFVGLIAIEPDFGNSMLLFGILVAMLYIAGAKLTHLITLMAVTLPPAVIFLYNKFPHIQARIASFLSTTPDPLGKDYQGIQGLIAIGSGGIFGKGLGEGLQKYYYLPEAHNDFIFAIIGEDFGLLGCSLVLFFYALLVWYAIQVCSKTSDLYSLLVCFGITLLFAGQALFNMGVVTNLVPNKGISLPLISYGGSNVLFSMIALGILIQLTKTLPPDRPRELGALRKPKRGTPLF